MKDVAKRNNSISIEIDLRIDIDNSFFTVNDVNKTNILFSISVCVREIFLWNINICVLCAVY